MINDNRMPDNTSSLWQRFLDVCKKVKEIFCKDYIHLPQKVDVVSTAFTQYIYKPFIARILDILHKGISWFYKNPIAFFLEASKVDIGSKVVIHHIYKPFIEKILDILHKGISWFYKNPIAFFLEALIFGLLVGQLDAAIWLECLSYIMPSFFFPLGLALFYCATFLLPILIFANIYDSLQSNTFGPLDHLIQPPEEVAKSYFYYTLHVLHSLYDTIKSLMKILFLTLIGYNIHSWIGATLYISAGLCIFFTHLRLSINRAKKPAFDIDLSLLMIPYTLLRVASGVASIYTLLHISFIALPLWLNMLLFLAITPFCLVTRSEKLKEHTKIEEKTKEYEKIFSPIVFISLVITAINCIYTSHNMLTFLIKILNPYLPLIFLTPHTFSFHMWSATLTILQVWIALGYYNINYYENMDGSLSLQKKAQDFMQAHPEITSFFSNKNHSNADTHAQLLNRNTRAI